MSSYGLDSYNQDIAEELSQPLRAHSGGDNVAKVYIIGSYGSNAWQSDNPNSGVYESEVARSIDSSQGGNPACNQGGTVIVTMDGVRTPLKINENGTCQVPRKTVK